MTKCRGLTAEGMTAHSWCGSYSLPAATITGSVRREVRPIALSRLCMSQESPLRWINMKRTSQVRLALRQTPAQGFCRVSIWSSSLHSTGSCTLRAISKVQCPFPHH